MDKSRKNKKMLHRRAKGSSSSKQGISISSYSTAQKMEICKQFKKTGQCSYGESCKFSHPDTNLIDHSVYADQVKKLEICHAFRMTGTCKYGQKCKFIHPTNTLPTNVDQKEYLYRVQQSFNSPCLYTDFNSNELFCFEYQKALNYRPYFRCTGHSFDFPFKREAVNALLFTTFCDSSDEDGFMIQSIVEKYSKEMSNLFGKIVTETQTMEEFRMVFIPFLFFLTSEKLSRGPLIPSSNGIFGCIQPVFEKMILTFNKYYPQLFEIGFKVVEDKRWFIPFVVGHYLFPLFSVVRVYMTRFKDERHLEILPKLFEIIENSFDLWEAKYNYDAELKDLESDLTIRAARQTISLLKKLSGHSLFERENQPDLSIIGSQFTYSDIIVPGLPKKHDNDEYDFRNIKIIPTKEEMTVEFVPSLPGNDHLNPKSSWLPIGPEKLFDTHFRLLREDVFATLKVGVGRIIDYFRMNPKRRDLHELRPILKQYSFNFFFDLQFEKLESVPFRGIITNYTFKTLKEYNKDDFTKLSQSLCLLLTINEDGRYFLHFGVFHQIYFQSPFPPKLQVKFLSDHEPECFLRGKYHHFLIIPKILFDSYYPFLKELQNFNTLNLPFQKYLFGPEYQNATLENGQLVIDTPFYAASQRFFFDLTFLVKDQTLHLYPTNNYSQLECIEILKKKSSLDDGQCESLVYGLSRELTCVQGPPGTGKSYLGVQMVKALLSAKESGLILIVCYTNHALDSFLCSLLDSGIEKFVRLGFRSDNERIKPFILQRKILNSRYGKRRQALQFKEYDDYFGVEMASKFLKPSNQDLLQYIASFNREFYNSICGIEEDGFQKVRYGNKEKMTSWLKQNLKKNNNPRDFEELSRSFDPWEFTYEEREIFMEGIRKLYFEDNQHRFETVMRSVEKNLTEIDRIDTEDFYDFIKNSNFRIIAMTTNGVAKRIDLLNRLAPRVLICEEAGEILEGQQLTFMRPSIQQMILIGDHQQLRPHISEYHFKLEGINGKKYALDMSQFERLQNPEFYFPLLKLNMQRRMRPEISQLIRVSLYPNLLDHESVNKYPNIKGVCNNLFFLNHLNKENSKRKAFSLSNSHYNEFEVQYVISLLEFLLHQGYSPDDITILTPYLGQLSLLRKRLSALFKVVLSERDQEDLETFGEEAQEETNCEKVLLSKRVRVSTVDNYQGEENRIIILSLVRNTGSDQDLEGGIGFLKTENRSNVALSRAKEGMYILGQRKLLESKSEFWRKVLACLESQGNIGDALKLYCLKHPDYENPVSEIHQFKITYPDGGCLRPCEIKLPKCGHLCPRKCHSDDYVHKDLYCPQPCQRLHDDCQHPCTKLCGDKCGNCMENVGDLLLNCGHINRDTPCYLKKDPEEIKCRVKVMKKVESCGHEFLFECFKEPDVCKKECGSLLECGHPCSGTCGKCLKSGSHPDCQFKCDKILACGHVCSTECKLHSEGKCPACEKTCQMLQCQHSKCGHACKDPCHPCIEVCNWGCEHIEPCQLPCSAPCIRPPCDKRCTNILLCGHQCPSLCSEECPEPKYCQLCADENIKTTEVDLYSFDSYDAIDLNLNPIVVLDCGHFFTVETLDMIVNLGAFYKKSADGKWSNELPEPPNSMVNPPVCPKCRVPIVRVKRINRMIKTAQLDQSEKRHIIRISEVFKEIESFIMEKEPSAPKLTFLTNMCDSVYNFPSEMTFEAAQAICIKKKIEMDKFILIPRPHYNLKANLCFQITRFISKFKPISKAIIKKGNGLFDKALTCAGKSTNMLLYWQIKFSRLKWDINLLKEQMNPNSSILPTVPPPYQQEEKEKLLQQAKSIKIQAVASFIYQHGNELDSLIEKLENGSIWELVTKEELLSVYYAMNVGQGHWYRCPNGHLFVIGDCGGAMEVGQCNECGAAIGGQHHQLISDNSIINIQEAFLHSRT